MPNSKINRWIRKHWEQTLGNIYNRKYELDTDTTIAVDFLTLVELHTFYQLSNALVRSNKILIAHQYLKEEFNTPYPFASKNVIERIQFDNKKIYFKNENDVIISLDGKFQAAFQFMESFFLKLDFNDEMLASRFWPMGKEKCIVCNPKKQFGQPIIDKTQILAESIYDFYMAGEPRRFIAEIYGTTLKNVDDAIALYDKAA